MNLAQYVSKRFLSGVIYRIYRGLWADVPLYTPGAISYLSKVLQTEKGARVFEWGSGHSTVWYALRASRVVAIEHDAEWYRWVRGRLAALGLTHAEVRYLPPMCQFNCVPVCALERAEYRAYVIAIDDFDDGYFQVVAVDGKERVACALRAIPKLRPGGVLVLDDSNRRRYAEIFDQLRGWAVRKFPFGLRETAVFLKP